MPPGRVVPPSVWEALLPIGLLAIRNVLLLRPEAAPLVRVSGAPLPDQTICSLIALACRRSHHRSDALLASERIALLNVVGVPRHCCPAGAFVCWLLRRPVAMCAISLCFRHAMAGAEQSSGVNRCLWSLGLLAGASWLERQR